MKTRILNYLANGLKAADVATIVGCSPAYISQLLAEDSFKEELRAKLIDQPEDAGEVRLDVRYEGLEHKLLSAMEVSLVDAELPAITRALEVITKRQMMNKQIKNPALQNGVNITMVSLTLPAHSVHQKAPLVQLNSQQEVISIEGMPLAPMASSSVKDLFATLSSTRSSNNTIQEVASANID